MNCICPWCLQTAWKMANNIKPGAYADLLIVEGNPAEDISVMVDYENNFKVIMKDGKVYKNTLKYY